MRTRGRFDLVWEFLFPGRITRAAIPDLDRALTPNNLLQDAPRIGPVLPSAWCVVRDGDTYLVGAGHRVLRVAEGSSSTQVVLETTGPVTSLGRDDRGHLVVAVEGAGLAAYDGATVVWSLTEVDGTPLRTVTAVALAPDGRLAIAQGSATHDVAQWQLDLMRRGSSGRVIERAPDGSTQVLATGLEWAGGIAWSPLHGGWVVAESWAHTVRRVGADGQRDAVVSDLPGYPAALAAGVDSLWIACIAPRNRLVEFVLGEDEFREAMLQTLPPVTWVAPCLATIASPDETIQGGQLRQLGVTKPWAPSRSYGLVLQVDADGEVLRSAHSRADGTRHGISALVVEEDQVVALSAGAGELVEVAW